MKNDIDPLPRIRQDKKSGVNNFADLLLRVRQDKKSRVKNDADLLLRVKKVIRLQRSGIDTIKYHT